MALRICILETDVIRPEFYEEFHSYGRMFQQLFAKQPIPAEFEVFNVVHGDYPDETEHFDAYLVTGSKSDSFGPDPWIQTLKQYLMKRYQNGDKLLGVCFGHQLLAILLGGTTERSDKGWGVGIHHYQMTETKSWMTPQVSDLKMIAVHQDQVTRLPENATLLASSEFCPYAAYSVGDQVLCFQGHPEFIHDFSKAVLELRRPIFGETLYQRSVDTLRHEQQGVTVAEWMMRFVAEGKHPA